MLIKLYWRMCTKKILEIICEIFWNKLDIVCKMKRERGLFINKKLDMGVFCFSILNFFLKIYIAIRFLWPLKYFFEKMGHFVAWRLHVKPTSFIACGILGHWRPRMKGVMKHAPYRCKAFDHFCMIYFFCIGKLVLDQLTCSILDFDLLRFQIWVWYAKV